MIGKSGCCCEISAAIRLRIADVKWTIRCMGWSETCRSGRLSSGFASDAAEVDGWLCGSGRSGPELGAEGVDW